MASKDSIQILLAGRTGAYQVFQNLLGNEPQHDLFEWLTSTEVKTVLELFKTKSNTQYSSALQTLNVIVEEASFDSDVNLERIRTGFTRLFVGPGKVEVDPWESVYGTKEAVLFQPNTLEVRKAYVAQGFIPGKYPHVADDHVGLELDFMARLGQKLDEAFDNNDIQMSLQLTEAASSFLQKHLLKWTPSFVDAFAQARHGYFYQEVAVLLLEFLRIDSDALDEIGTFLKGVDQGVQ
jgi:TorA maturation chaperone TorD